MLTVKYDDRSAACDFVSFADPMEHRACISLDTGAIYWISELNPIEEVSGRSPYIRRVHRRATQARRERGGVSPG